MPMPLLLLTSLTVFVPSINKPCLIFELESPLRIILALVFKRATGQQHPQHPCCSQSLLSSGGESGPVALLLYSKPIQKEHFCTVLAGELVTVDDRVSQGSSEGTPFAITDDHGFVNETLHARPDCANKVNGR